ncbi:hypothetical protein PR048_024562 [Dryococelus australis]|uniref:Uncharacterized protein n=1 Tax=Dryococelus australis TaxID=614101 RepID=A0ABQ9GP08_9NEOP|nr:hypothetical protein PR048_024562 [Dryococelus australis]
MRAKRVEYGAAPEFKGGEKRENPEKTRIIAASSATIPTFENPGATPPGTEPGSPWASPYLANLYHTRNTKHDASSYLALPSEAVFASNATLLALLEMLEDCKPYFLRQSK